MSADKSTTSESVKLDVDRKKVLAEKKPSYTISKKLLLGLLIAVLLGGIGVGIYFGVQELNKDEKSPPPPPPSSMNLIGAWTSNYNNDITITSTTFYDKSSYGTNVFNIEKWGDGWILAQNAATNAYNPSKWSIHHFHTSGSGYGYCQSITDGASADAVLSTDMSTVYDASNAATGCGASGFAHTILTAYTSPLIGAWTSNWGSDITVTSTTWTDVSSSSTTKFNIEAWGVGWILAQNAATNGWNPSKWSIFQFHTSGSGYGYCQSIPDGASALAVLDADKTLLYDSSDAATGCGASNFSHTILTAA
jgi:hypothetical protein